MTESKAKYWGKLIGGAGSGQTEDRAVLSRTRDQRAFFLLLAKAAAEGCSSVRFALLDTVAAATSRPACALELVLRNGERLRIGDKVDAVALRVVLEAVRG